MRECMATHDSFVSYGLGLEYHPAAFGQGHNGANPGYLIVARHGVDTDVTAVFLTAHADYDKIVAATDRLYDTVTKVRAAAGH